MPERRARRGARAPPPRDRRAPGVRSKSPKTAGKATSTKASAAADGGEGQHAPAQGTARPARGRHGHLLLSQRLGEGGRRRQPRHHGAQAQRGERVGRADAAAAVGVDAEQDEDEGGRRRQRRARAHEDRELVADHAGPTSRTLAPAGEARPPGSASLCAASTSATQLAVRRGRHVDEPRARPVGGAAPAPATRIRGATAAPATHPHPAVAPRAGGVCAAGRPTWSAQTTSAPRARRRGEQAVERRAGGVVQAGRRLVEDDHVGLARQRRREGDALALAVGEGGQRALAAARRARRRRPRRRPPPRGPTPAGAASLPR